MGSTEGSIELNPVNACEAHWRGRLVGVAWGGVLVIYA